MVGPSSALAVLRMLQQAFWTLNAVEPHAKNPNLYVEMNNTGAQLKMG